MGAVLRRERGTSVIVAKRYARGGEVLVAACDDRLLGRTLREGQVRLHVSSFYEGDRVTEEQFVALLRLATIGNFVGRETVDAARKAGFVGDDGVLWIEGEPHAQMVLMAGPD